MSKHHFIVTSFMVLGAAALTSCQKGGQNGSDTKTLDQMASGSGSNYTCAAENQVPANSYVSNVAMEHVFLSNGSKCSDSKNASSAVCKAMKDVLNVVAAKSEILVKNYFESIKGDVILSNQEVTKLCQSSFADPKSPQFVKEDLRPKIDGCWSIPQLSKDSYAVTMVHKEDANSIRKNGIRVLGMFYGQAVQQMSLENGKFRYNLDYKADDSVRKSLWDHKNELAAKFLEDVKAGEASGVYSLANLPYLTAEGIEKIRKKPVELEVSLFDNGLISQQRFVDNVMGEAFDSGFCQAAQTASANGSTFKNTMAIFNSQILPGLLELAAKMGTDVAPSATASNAVASNVSGAATNGFGLGGFGGFFSNLANMIGGGMAGGTANNPAVDALNKLRMNPTNNPQAAGYNPNLAQAANQAMPNYNPALLQQQTAALQQQAAMPAQSGMTSPYGSNPYTGSALAKNPVSAGLGGGLLAMFSGLRSSNVGPNGDCSIASGGCSGPGCPGGCCNCV